MNAPALESFIVFHPGRSLQAAGILAMAASLASPPKPRTPPRVIELRRSAMLAWLANLYHAWRVDRWLIVVGDSHYYLSKSWKTDEYGYLPMRFTQDLLCYQGMIAVAAGSFAKHKRTRIIPTAKLSNMFAALTAAPAGKPVVGVKGQFVVLRDSNGAQMVYEPTPETIAIQRLLEAYHEMMYKHEVVVVIDGQPRVVAPELERVFNRGDTPDRWRVGGRYYGGAGGIQSLPREVRATITINGEPTADCDYKAIHPSICYAIAGSPAPEDVYAIPGVDKRLRPIIKKLLLYAFNANSIHSVAKAFEKCIWRIRRKPVESLKEKDTKLLRAVDDAQLDYETCIGLLNRIMSAHKPIRGYFFSGIGRRLQCFDSAVMTLVLNHCVTSGIPVLQVYDAVIVQRRLAEEIAAVMRQSYRTVIGQDILVEIS